MIELFDRLFTNLKNSLTRVYFPLRFGINLQVMKISLRTLLRSLMEDTKGSQVNSVKACYYL